MVKGLSRKVIVVKSPDPKIFEQAIFVVREDYFSKQGISQKQLLRQAKKAANGYIGESCGHFGKGFWYSVAAFLLGAVVSASIWYFI